jgi:hypothetical protein
MIKIEYIILNQSNYHIIQYQLYSNTLNLDYAVELRYET